MHSHASLKCSTESRSLKLSFVVYLDEIGWILAKLRQVEDKEVVCAAAVFSIFLLLKFILFCLLEEYLVSVSVKAACIAHGIINKLERSRSIYLFSHDTP